jgi:signal transduction histidine kinase
MQVKAIFGNRAALFRASWKRLKAWVHRHDFVIGMGFATLVLFSGFVLAIYDFTTSAKQQDQKIQSTTLDRELSDFFLRTRDPEGSSLLENPQEFTKENRPLQVVSIKRPFFSYFLTKSNFKNFQTEALRFEPPRACALDFEIAERGRNSSAQVVQACFAAIPDDAAGHYVYFSIRYPSAALQRHKQGRPLSESDRLVLKFSGIRETKVFLVPERPPQATVLSAIQSKRLDGFHEMAAFTADDVGRPARAVNAQAFERGAEGSDQKVVTVLGRIDASLFPPAEEAWSVWPSRDVKSFRIGIQVIPASNGSFGKPFGFDPGISGRANASLERAYKTAVQSRAELVVTSLAAESGSVPLWRSVDIENTAPSRTDGIVQWFGEAMAHIFLSGRNRISVERQQTLSGLPPLNATLSADAVVIPDIAARALGWLIAGAGVIFVVGVMMFIVSTRLQRLTRTAYDVAWKHKDGSLESYAKAKDQIGTLGRALYALFKRDRNRMERNQRRIERENQQREAAMFKEQEYVDRRKSILLAIGHQIRSPLGNLKASISPDQREYRELMRMEHAIEALYAANRIEEGLRNGDIVVNVFDIASYLHSLVAGYQDKDTRISYEGVVKGVDATFDDIVMQGVLDQLIENAGRYVIAGTDIVIRLTTTQPVVTIEVFNQGPPIADTESIFDFGVTDRANSSNMGLGLYAAKVHMSAMNGRIWAENRATGVAFMLTLPAA